MNIVMIPGFWLDGNSWNNVAAPLTEAGHTVRTLTLPGLESPDADRSGITLRDHVDAVVAAIDAAEGPVVLVGHSGGGAIAHAAVDARPEQVSRVVYVDSGPLGDGLAINDELPVVGDEVPLPDWSLFEDADLTDLDDELRDMFRSIAIPEPARVTSDPQQLGDERRYDVPVTVICCEFTSDALRDWMAAGVPFFAELARVKDATLVDLPTGHWPQFTRPRELASVILDAIDSTGEPNSNDDTGVSLHPWTADDLPVLERSNTPEMTVYIGGPESVEKLAERQERFMRLWESGEARMFTISAADATERVGSVGYWTTLWHGEPVYETGWSVATAYQGRGYATRALRLCLEHAAAGGDRDSVLAFPRVDNQASNALCEKLGFEFIGEEDFEYPKGHPIRVNAWLFDLSLLRTRRVGSED